MHIDWKTMSTTERYHVLESQIFLTEKKDGLIKGRHFANGNPQRQWMDLEQVSSPTIITESMMITTIIEGTEMLQHVTFGMHSSKQKLKNKTRMDIEQS